MLKIKTGITRIDNPEKLAQSFCKIMNKHTNLRYEPRPNERVVYIAPIKDILEDGKEEG